MSHNHLGTNAGPEGVVVARVRHSHGRGKGAAIVRSRGSIIWESVVTVVFDLPSGCGLHSILVDRNFIFAVSGYHQWIQQYTYLHIHIKISIMI